MTWFYDVRKNVFERDGVFQFQGMYAGSPGYKNNPDFECVVNKGPLPRGKYHIGRPIAVHPKAGKYVLRLTPYADNNMCGRDGFLIHGGNGRGTASQGCIVVEFDKREKIARSGDRDLIVK